MTKVGAGIRAFVPQSPTAALRLALRELKKPVQYLKGVGPRRAQQLEKLGIRTVEDLLYHLPFRYQDRRVVKKVAHLAVGEEAATVGEVVRLKERFMHRSRRWVLEGVVRDETGFLFLLWYHQVHYFKQRFRPGQRVLLYGRVEMGMRGGKWMIHPDIELLGEGRQAARILPVYNKTAGLTSKTLRQMIHRAVLAYAPQVPTTLPQEIRMRQGLMDLGRALRFLHLPPVDADIGELNLATSRAHRSVVFDELFYLQLGMALRKGATAKEEGNVLKPGPLTQKLQAVLPFTLTAAQERVLAEIFTDMATPHPMNRLIQGDVGSGKTVLALFAALAANDSGYQAALMAPTELLAEQHFGTLSTLAEKVGVSVALLTGEVRGKRRQELYNKIREGTLPLVVGTHALIQEGVEFGRLGLAIVDEQHRFGVLQRAALKRLGGNPDVLLMTATPIPRTLALTLYGDLDVSILDELPPGRKPVTTRIFHEGEREEVYCAVRAELEQGHQAYVIYPLVEESERSDLKAATTMARELSRTFFAGYRVGLVHGRMRGEEKERVLRHFKAGAYQLLVSTTVIEVGIDVPNATVMVVEHAERFGLAQLHQLRGRVGRGEAPSFCYLLAQYAPADDAHRRLQVLVETNDGFRIAEADLALRGPGEFLGTRQSGLPDFRVANIVRDSRLLEAAREEALHWLEKDPTLTLPTSRALRQVLRDRWAGRLELARVG